MRTVAGASKFYPDDGRASTAQISKPIALADSAVLTPYIGAQRLIIFADSAVVDLTPSVDRLAAVRLPGTTRATRRAQNCSAHAAGRPVCRTNGDFNNTRRSSGRASTGGAGSAGLDYEYELLYLAGQFAMDLTDPGAENANLGVSGERQWTMSLEAGVSF